MKDRSLKKSLELFITFAKIGLFTFGGGYAMISIIDRICAEEKRWITHEEMMDITVMAESTPGPVAINCSTFVGYRQQGLRGALFATFGMILPSFVIIFLLSCVFDSFLSIPWVKNAFTGIKAAVGILIVDAGIKLFKQMEKKPLQIILLITSLIAMLVINIFSLNISSVTLMLSAAFVSLCFYALKRVIKGKERSS
ncbi:MAG: chromate transporter [Lachnospiraceae bacterium]|nr:chromate transporter [Lachnospiraceae bacterium]